MPNNLISVRLDDHVLVVTYHNGVPSDVEWTAFLEQVSWAVVHPDVRFLIGKGGAPRSGGPRGMWSTGR